MHVFLGYCSLFVRTCTSSSSSDSSVSNWDGLSTYSAAMSTGTIIGIVVGAISGVVFLVFVIVAIVCICKRRPARVWAQAPQQQRIMIANIPPQQPPMGQAWGSSQQQPQMGQAWGSPQQQPQMGQAASFPGSGQTAQYGFRWNLPMRPLYHAHPQPKPNYSSSTPFQAPDWLLLLPIPFKFFLVCALWS